MGQWEKAIPPTAPRPLDRFSRNLKYNFCEFQASRPVSVPDICTAHPNFVFSGPPCIFSDPPCTFRAFQAAPTRLRLRRSSPFRSTSDTASSAPTSRPLTPTSGVARTAPARCSPSTRCRAPPTWSARTTCCAASWKRSGASTASPSSARAARRSRSWKSRRDATARGRGADARSSISCVPTTRTWCVIQRTLE